VADLGWSVHHAIPLISSCLQDLCFFKFGFGREVCSPAAFLQSPPPPGCANDLSKGTVIIQSTVRTCGAGTSRTCDCPGDTAHSEVGPSLLVPLGLLWLLLGGLGPIGAITGRGCGDRLMGRRLGGNPMGPLPGSVDNSGVWNRAATEHQSSNTIRNPQPHSKLDKTFTLTQKHICFR
jgi:hypothetical protein